MSEWATLREMPAVAHTRVEAESMPRGPPGTSEEMLLPGG